jgi:hypothetical protein
MMSSKVFFKDEEYWLFNFKKIEPIEVVVKNGVRVTSLQPTNLIGGLA